METREGKDGAEGAGDEQRLGAKDLEQVTIPWLRRLQSGSC